MPILLLVLSFLLSPEGEELKYPVGEIKEEDKAGMYAVIREHEMKYTLTSVNGSNIYHHSAITILNSNAKEHATVSIWYDKHRLLRSCRASVYDGDGRLIKRVKQSDFLDQSASDGSSLFADDRIKWIDLSQVSYPYTVEFEYEIQNKYLFYIPAFDLYKDDEIFIQKKKLSLIYHDDLKPRYQLYNIAEPSVSVTGGETTISWSFQNIKPAKFEAMGPPSEKLVPHVLVAPDQFGFDSYRGRMNTWDGFAKWQILLNEGRDELPEATKSLVRQMTQGAKTDEEKARILYQYLQQKTRYVGVQLGIGGWQPFEAATVDQTGYGDCKALSNYMVALLKAANVKGYYTLIYAGKNEPDIDATFPSNQFNHVIVSIPQQRDTLWLECTSQSNPFGYVGSFTGNRHALIITEGGGKIVKTPRYSAEQNVKSFRGDVTIDPAGSAKAKITATYEGLAYEANGLRNVLDQSKDDQKKWVNSNTHIPVFDLSAFSMREKKDRIPMAAVTSELVMRQYATVNGNRIFVMPNLLDRSAYVPEAIAQRKTDIVVLNAALNVDTMTYHFPEGVHPEFLPQPVSIKSRFGEYDATVKMDQNGLLYIRRLKINAGTFPPEAYGEMIEFYKGIRKADNAKVLFQNKT